MFNLAALLLIAALLTPSFVKLAHVFENHKHEICKTPGSSHFHEFDVDCEFYKFKLSTQFAFAFADIIFIDSSVQLQELESQYISISEYQRLPFSLRGPPVLV